MERILISQLENKIDEEILIKGWVHKVRKLSKITFLIIRDRTGIVQCVLDNECIDIKGLKLESAIEIKGIVKKSNNSIGNVEIQVSEFEVTAPAVYDIPIQVNTENLENNIDTVLNHRVVSLRNLKTSSIFKVQAAIVRGFSEYLSRQGFTEVFTPKIVSEGAEGGTAIFELKYFEKKAYLAQSPQCYKEMLVGAGFERVFEIGHVYRAEEHNTLRHLNEYVSLDLEMGFIKDEYDLINLETELLKCMIKLIADECKNEIEVLKASLPEIQDKIPCMKLSEAIEILKLKYGKNNLEEDLDSEGEKLIGEYVKEKYNSDFVFLTHYPRSKRPMYAMPFDEKLTKSFDLIFRGMEITSGGQRIHDYEMLRKNMIYKGLNPENFTSYLEAFKYGMPPHGGFAIGLERFTALLLGYKNVREASLFPRDRERLAP